VTYRDDLAAAQERVTQLERRLAEEREAAGARVAALEAKLRDARDRRWGRAAPYAIAAAILAVVVGLVAALRARGTPRSADGAATRSPSNPKGPEPTAVASTERPAPIDDSCSSLRARAGGPIGQVLKLSAIHGTGVAHAPDIHYGYASKSTEVEMLDPVPVVEKHGVRWLKVRVVCAAEKTNEGVQGRVGWIDMRDTSFSDGFDPKGGAIVR
jgi:hypothetical protein